MGTGIYINLDRGNVYNPGSSSSSKKPVQTSTGNKTTTTSRPSSSGSRGGKTPGTIYTSGGKQYIVSSSGMSVQLDTDAGKRVQNQYNGGSSSGSSSNRNGLQVDVKGAQDYTGNYAGSKNSFQSTSPYGFSTPTIKKYMNNSGITAADGDKYRTQAVARLKSGAKVSQKYIDENPNKEYYTLDSSPNIRSSGTIGGVPRYGSGSSSYGMIFNGKPVGIVGADGVVYYPDNVEVPVDAWAAMQAQQDYNYGNALDGSDLMRQNMPDTYYQVMSDYANGLGRNGYGLRGGSAEHTAIWGDGVFNADAYNQLAAEGRVAPYRDYWGEYGKLSPETGGFSKSYYAPPLVSGDGNNSNNQTITAPAGGYTGVFDINNNQKGIPNTGLGGVNTSAMREAMEAALDAQRASTQAAQQQYTNMIPEINQEADLLARQAYTAMKQQENALPQQLAAMGYGGGLSESSAVDLQTGYETNRNNILRDRDSAIRDIQSQAAMIGAQGDAAEAGIRADYLSQIAQMEEAARQAQAQRAWEAYQAELNRQWQAQQAAQDFENQKEYFKLQQQYKGSGNSGNSKPSVDWDMLNNTNKILHENGYFDDETFLNNSLMIAQGIVPTSLNNQNNNSQNNSFGGNIATRPVSQAEKESAIRALSNRGYTNEQIQAYIANMGW